VRGSDVAGRAARLAIATAAAVAVLHLLNEGLLDGRIDQFDATREANAPTWASTVTTFSAALSATLLAAVGPARRAAWLALGVAIGFLSLDDGAQVHETLGSAAASVLDVGEDTERHLQILTVLPVVGAVFLGLWWISRDMPKRLRNMVRAGLLSLGAALVVEEGVGSATHELEDRGVYWPDVLRNAAEESLELGGWGLVAAGLMGCLVAVLTAGD
jgi:hypothetical protein